MRIVQDSSSKAIEVCKLTMLWYSSLSLFFILSLYLSFPYFIFISLILFVILCAPQVKGQYNAEGGSTAPGVTPAINISETYYTVLYCLNLLAFN
jgi:hypothetical protein